MNVTREAIDSILQHAEQNISDWAECARDDTDEERARQETEIETETAHLDAARPVLLAAPALHALAQSIVDAYGAAVDAGDAISGTDAVDFVAALVTRARAALAAGS